MNRVAHEVGQVLVQLSGFSNGTELIVSEDGDLALNLGDVLPSVTLAYLIRTCENEYRVPGLLADLLVKMTLVSEKPTTFKEMFRRLVGFGFLQPRLFQQIFV